MLRTSLEQRIELRAIESGLTKDRTQCSPREFAMRRDDDHASSVTSQFHMAAALADLHEARTLESCDHLST